MSTNQVNCQNCEEPFEKGFKFCPNCGQKTNEELTLRVLFYNTICNYFSFDARFIKSFVPLMFKPGFLASKYLEGKRLMYLHPAQMYLFISVVFFFVFNFYARAGREEIDKQMQGVLSDRTENVEKVKHNLANDSLTRTEGTYHKTDKSYTFGLDEKDLKVLDSLTNVKVPKKDMGMSFKFDEKELDSLLAVGAKNEDMLYAMGMPENAGYFKRRFFNQVLKFYKTMGLSQIYQTFIDSIPIAMFFLLPIFAFLLKLFFYNKGRYSHHLVFSFYYFSFLFLVFSILFAINEWIYDIPDWIDWIIAFSTFFYLFFAIKNYYVQHWFWSFFKSGLVSFLFLILVLPFSFVILGMIAFFFY